MKWIKSLLLATLLSLLLILSACGDGVASGADLSSYPESVQDGTVTVEYYKQINDFYSDSVTYLTQIVGEDSYDEGVIELLDEYNKALSRYKVKPKTKVEEEIDLQLRKVIRFQTDLNNFKIEHFKTSSADLEWEMATTSSMLSNMVNDLENVTDKYEIRQ